MIPFLARVLRGGGLLACFTAAVGAAVRAPVWVVAAMVAGALAALFVAQRLAPVVPPGRVSADLETEDSQPGGPSE